MATNTYVALDTATATGSQSTITFTSIPQTYTDLVLVCSGNTVNLPTALRFNNDTGTNYSRTGLRGYSSTADSFRQTAQPYLAIDASVSQPFQNAIIHIQNYSNSTTRKTALWRSNRATDGVEAMVGLWYGTIAAINRIDVISTGGTNFTAGSTFTIYGIAATSVGAKATGGYITSDSQYYYHTFFSNGTFTPTQALTCDYLVVAGGGGGGNTYGGGGGAGGLRSTVTATGGGGSLETPLSLSATGYTVTVGAGGTASANGNDSVFGSITSIAGGRGATYNTISAGTGGSGGGGAGSNGQVPKGSGTANQGFDGTDGATSGNYGAGAGGGAGAVGGTPSTNSGIGGAGVATSISGTSTTYAGGGGGGKTNNGALAAAGGLGGGGAGSDTGNGTNGSINTGGGGGGAFGASGGTGGSGIVIVRYAK